MTTFSTELDLTVLEHLEFAPPCEYIGLVDGTDVCGAPAEWLFIGLLPVECGCIMPDRYFCDECKIRRQSWPYITCIKCGTKHMPNDTTLFRFERIDGRP